jgi:hypothetical protein
MRVLTASLSRHGAATTRHDLPAPGPRSVPPFVANGAMNYVQGPLQCPMARPEAMLERPVERAWSDVGAGLLRKRYRWRHRVVVGPARRVDGKGVKGCRPPQATRRRGSRACRDVIRLTPGTKEGTPPQARLPGGSPRRLGDAGGGDTGWVQGSRSHPRRSLLLMRPRGCGPNAARARQRSDSRAGTCTDKGGVECPPWTRCDMCWHDDETALYQHSATTRQHSATSAPNSRCSAVTTGLSTA